MTDREDVAIQLVQDSNSIGEQRRRGQTQSFAFLLAACLCVAGWVLLSWGRGGNGDANGIALSGRVNPNQAPVASLTRLPGIGAVRAAAIVAYREQARGGEEGAQPFRRCDDLQKIKGIGPKTAEKMQDYLEFDQVVYTD